MRPYSGSGVPSPARRRWGTAGGAPPSSPPPPPPPGTTVDVNVLSPAGSPCAPPPPWSGSPGSSPGSPPRFRLGSPDGRAAWPPGYAASVGSDSDAGAGATEDLMGFLAELKSKYGLAQPAPARPAPGQQQVSVRVEVRPGCAGHAPPCAQHPAEPLPRPAPLPQLLLPPPLVQDQHGHAEQPGSAAWQQGEHYGQAPLSAGAPWQQQRSPPSPAAATAWQQRSPPSPVAAAAWQQQSPPSPNGAAWQQRSPPSPNGAAWQQGAPPPNGAAWQHAPQQQGRCSPNSPPAWQHEGPASDSGGAPWRHSQQQVGQGERHGSAPGQQGQQLHGSPLNGAAWHQQGPAPSGGQPWQPPPPLQQEQPHPTSPHATAWQQQGPPLASGAFGQPPGRHAQAMPSSGASYQPSPPPNSSAWELQLQRGPLARGADWQQSGPLCSDAATQHQRPSSDTASQQQGPPRSEATSWRQGPPRSDAGTQHQAPLRSETASEHPRGDASSQQVVPAAGAGAAASSPPQLQPATGGSPQQAQLAGGSWQQQAPQQLAAAAWGQQLQPAEPALLPQDALGLTLPAQQTYGGYSGSPGARQPMPEWMLSSADSTPQTSPAKLVANPAFEAAGQLAAAGSEAGAGPGKGAASPAVDASHGAARSGSAAAGDGVSGASPAASVAVAGSGAGSAASSNASVGMPGGGAMYAGGSARASAAINPLFELNDSVLGLASGGLAGAGAAASSSGPGAGAGTTSTSNGAGGNAVGPGSGAGDGADSPGDGTAGDGAAGPGTSFAGSFVGSIAGVPPPGSDAAAASGASIKGDVPCSGAHAGGSSSSPGNTPGKPLAAPPPDQAPMGADLAAQLAGKQQQQQQQQQRRSSGSRMEAELAILEEAERAMEEAQRLAAEVAADARPAPEHAGRPQQAAAGAAAAAAVASEAQQAIPEQSGQQQQAAAAATGEGAAGASGAASGREWLVPPPRGRRLPWGQLHTLLVRRGFPGLFATEEEALAADYTELEPDRVACFDVIHSLLEDQARVAAHHRRLSESLEAAQRREGAIVHAFTTAAKRRAEETSKWKRLAIDNQVAARDARGAAKTSTATEHQAVVAAKRLQGDVDQLTHELRSKEAELERARNMLRVQVEREERRAQADREAYDRLKRAHAASKAADTPSAAEAAVKAAARDMRPIDICRVFEAERANLAEAAAAAAADAAAARAQLELAQEALHAAGLPCERFEEIEGQARSAARAVAAAEERARAATEAVAMLQLELAARPTQAQYESLKRQATIMERQLAKAAAEKKAEEEDKGTIKSVRPKPKQLSTRDMIQRDRNMQRLGLQAVEDMPKPVLVEVLQDACALLECGAPLELCAAIKPVQELAALVPRMERFIGDVCGAVFQAGLAHVPEALRQDNPADVPAILGAWISELGELVETRGVLRRLLRQLASRVSLQPDDPAPTAGEVVPLVAQLVELERKVFHSREVLEAAEAALAAQPEILINRICLQFQRLFGCKSLEGVLPAMNKLYLAHTEAQTFLSSLRLALGLDPGATLEACANRLQQLLDSRRAELGSLLPAAEPHGAVPVLPRSAEAVVVEVAPRRRSSGQGSHGELQAAGRVAVERMAARRHWPKVEIYVPAAEPQGGVRAPAAAASPAPAAQQSPEASAQVPPMALSVQA